MHVPTAARPDEKHYYKEPADGIPEHSSFFHRIEAIASASEVPKEYQSFPDDIPFRLNNKGNMILTAIYPHGDHTGDSAINTACGISGKPPSTPGGCNSGRPLKFQKSIDAVVHARRVHLGVK